MGLGMRNNVGTCPIMELTRSGNTSTAVKGSHVVEDDI